MERLKLSNNKIKELKSLQLKKNREKTGLFIVEGKKSVADTLGTFELVHLVCTDAWLRLNPEFMKFGNKLLIADNKALRQISTLTTPADVMAVYRIPLTTHKEFILDPTQYYLLLDNLQDPGNLGTIIRTCDWFGIYDIYASPETVDVYNPKVVQASMGSLSRVTVRYVDLEVLITKNKSMPVYGTLLEGESIKIWQPKEGGMILMGNEGKGISENLKRLITEAITIPPFNPERHPDSLNVGIATAVILSKLRIR